MRNKVQLYIEGERADLDNGSFLLLNYTAEDLSNPTVVRNSFSKQITLPGTPRNDALFGFIFRNDRNTLYGSPYNGAYFDPCRKTAFALYSDEGLLLESGYLKLEKVTQTKRKRAYTVSLYGGLGSFLYGLSYDTSGNKLTLADLTFPYTLDFTIDRATVKAAWDQLYNDPDAANKWSVINFAPCYNGKPSKPFDANKAVVHAGTVGLPVTDGDYSTRDGFTLVSLNEEVTEQESKDYRSYLQRPVLRMKALINAICNSANNGGYTVNLDSEFFDDGNPYWSKTWLTLPMLQDLNIDVSQTNGYQQLSHLGTVVPLPDPGNLDKTYYLDFTLGLRAKFATPPAVGTNWVMHCEDDWAAGMQGDDSPGFYFNWIEYPIEIRDTNNNVITQTTFRVSTKAAPDGYPPMDYVADYIRIMWDADAGEYRGVFYKDGSPMRATLEMTGMGWAIAEASPIDVKGISYGHLQNASAPMYIWEEGYYDFNQNAEVQTYYFDDDSILNYAAVSSGTVRTGATITKAALLSGEHTPADYLLSFCKMFGLQMVVHKDEKVVDIEMRKNLYSSTVVDINGRIDRGRGVEKVPFSFDSRWYAWQTPHAGDWAEYYAEKYGEYGKYRVNTGFAFNADEKAVTDGIVFNGVCDALEVSKYFCDIEQDDIPIPSVFLAGGKYTLYKGGGELKEYELPAISVVGRKWINASYPMHDDWTKPQFHQADNAHLDLRDVLLFYYNSVYPYSDHCTLSDDTREMLALNGNNPCWLPGFCDYDTTWQLARMPRFSRYLWNVSNVTKSLDFGDPLEAQVPGINFNADSNIFDQYWDRYIADRYDDDSAVVTAWVDLRGMQVDENLLRQFYAFDGAVWALNRIIDHSLTTSGPTKCEFVKVQDITNYTTL